MIKNQIEELSSKIRALGHFIRDKKISEEFYFSQKLLEEIMLCNNDELLDEIKISFSKFIEHDFGELNTINLWSYMIPDFYQKHTLVGRYTLKSINNSLIIRLSKDRDSLNFLFNDEDIIN